MNLYGTGPFLTRSFVGSVMHHVEGATACVMFYIYANKQSSIAQLSPLDPIFILHSGNHVYMRYVYACTVGGATALIACSVPTMAAWHGFQFVVAVTLGSVIMLALALIFNNICKDREYPTYWW